jgi:hypothetical protein
MKPQKSHSQRSHSRISPSGLKSLQTCPGYEPEDKPEGDASKRGTFLHEIMERGKLPPQPWPAYMRSDDPELAQKILTVVKRADAQSEYEPLKEVELDFTPLKLKDFEKGHADRIIILGVNDDEEPEHAEMIDFKFGAWEVEQVNENIQFRAYALGLFIQFPSLQSVRVRIIQPELGLDANHTFLRARDYDMIVTQIGAVVRRRHKWLETRDTALLRSNPDNCSFCGAQATCAIWQQQMARMANDANVLSAPVVPIEHLEDPSTADVNELLRAYRWIKPMEEYLKKFKRFALAVYDAGLISDELTLTEKKGDASILDPLFVRDFLKERYGVSHDEFIASCDISIGSIRNLVQERSKHGEKEAKGKEAIDALTKEGVISFAPSIRYVQLPRGKKSNKS